MNRPNYLAEANRPVRLAAVAALLAATLVSAAVFLVVVAGMLVVKGPLPWGAMVGCLVIFGALAAASGWMLVRLLRGQRAANGRTVMPERFIQLFGVVFLLGLCATAVFTGAWRLLSEAAAVAAAMIFIPRLLREAEAAESAPIDA